MPTSMARWRTPEEAVREALEQEVADLRELADSEGTRAVKYLRRARKAEAEIEAALPAMREYARRNPVHHFGETPQDTNGVHAWLARNDLPNLGGGEPDGTKEGDLI